MSSRREYPPSSAWPSGQTRAQRALHVVLALLLLTVPASAGTLEVLGNSATVGAFGLRATLGAICSTDDIIVPPGTVSSDQLACDSITAANVEVVAPGSTFTAGERVVLMNGFSVAANAPFVVEIDSSVDSPYAFLTNGSPTSETVYNARFDLDLDAMTLELGESIAVFEGLLSNGTSIFRLLVRRNAAPAENRLILQARDDVVGDLVEHPTALPLPSGSNRIQIFWQMGAGTGEFTASINGSAFDGLTGLENASNRIDSVRLGLVLGPMVVTSSGFLETDDFFSWR